MTEVHEWREKMLTLQCAFFQQKNIPCIFTGADAEGIE